jgi:tetraacyldisaccharide 4'-kinase
MIKLKYPGFWYKRNLLTYMLMPISYIYMFLGYVRGKFTRQIKLPGTVICVGNISVGGSGKTQVVAWLAGEFSKKNISFVIVTKAYKSKLTGAKIVQDNDTALEVGDESIILKSYGLVIAAKKLKCALSLIEQINPQVVILDDGMQNPLLYKDLQIVVLGSNRGVGNNLIFPAGPLRESLDSGLTKADLIFMIEGGVSERDHPFKSPLGFAMGSYVALRSPLDDGLVEKPLFKASIKFKDAIPKNIDYIAFAGIGIPEKFYSSLAAAGVRVKQHISFEDHYNYSANDLKKLVELAQLENCQLITTEKDYIKIPENYKNQVTCAKVFLEFEKPEECINLIYEKILQKS